MHPFAPLECSEIRETARIIQSAWLTSTSLRFKAIMLHEPEKRLMEIYLDAEHRGKHLPSVDRKAFAAYYIRNTSCFHEAIVNLTSCQIERNVRLPTNVHGWLDDEEVSLVEKTVLESEKVKLAVSSLGLPAGTKLVADPWPYGSDKTEGEGRMYQVYMYTRDPANSENADSNHYAFPLPISPVVECISYKVVRVDMLPTGADLTIKAPPPYQKVPANEYSHEFNKPRRGLKPLNIIQPDGASFTVEKSSESGYRLEWQKWQFRVGFNQREGMVLYDVRYDGRPLFYRVSLSDLSIPYGDPRAPYNKKASFDCGDVGAGATANNLKLGCDCLGHIQYLSANLSTPDGDIVPMENVVCVHEQDAGIGWKHTNYRTNNASITRSRELVLQSIITVANYEYILAFIFNQAAELTYEVRATGILSTQPIDHKLNEKGVPFGTVVHPGVLAAHHQHIFSLRVDPMIDGYRNQLAYEEAFPMPLDPVTNPQAVGYITQETVVEETCGLDLNTETNRTFKILNPSQRNPINGKAVGYKLQIPPFQKGVAHSSSLHAKRAEFVDHNIYVTKYRERELFSGGWYTTQSRGGDGVRSWANRKENISNSPGSDIIVWIQFGINHIPRLEDFPVMPCEILKVSLKPVNFFTKNPALDVPASRQIVNQSSLITQMLCPKPATPLGEKCHF